MSFRTLTFVACTITLCLAFASGAEANAKGGEAASCAATQRTLASSARASGLKSFNDFIEDTRGPDICGDNIITNDNENTITFGIHVHNRSDFNPNEAYGVFLDTDVNPLTGGGGGGAEYRVRFTREETVLGKWDGTAFAPLATLEPATWVRGYGPVFQLNAKDIEDVRAFNFAFFATDGFNGDVAPNRGFWSYQLAPLELAARKLTKSWAKAGRPFTAQMVVMRSDWDEPLDEGTIACSGKLGAKTMTGAGRFAAGRVACTWRLPRNARGKRFTGAVSVTFQGVEARRTFTAAIR